RISHGSATHILYNLFGKSRRGDDVFVIDARLARRVSTTRNAPCHARKSPMHEIKATEIGELLRGRMGLIIGPSLTTYSGCFSDLGSQLAKKGGIRAQGTYLEVADALLTSGTSDAQAVEWIREIV